MTTTELYALVIGGLKKSKPGLVGHLNVLANLLGRYAFTLEEARLATAIAIGSELIRQVEHKDPREDNKENLSAWAHWVSTYIDGPEEVEEAQARVSKAMGAIRSGTFQNTHPNSDGTGKSASEVGKARLQIERFLEAYETSEAE